MDGWMRFSPQEEREAEKAAEAERERLFGHFGTYAEPLSEGERDQRRADKRRDAQLDAWIPT